MREKSSGIVVIAREGENIDSLIKRFKKKVNNSGIMKELKRKSHYLKPSEAKRIKRIEAQKRRIKEELKQKKGNKSNEKNQSN